MIVPRREPEFSLNSIDGQKVWPKEERDLFFRKSSGENAVAMMDEWSRGRCGRITNIGALNDIARKMADDGIELTAENLFKYYFTGKLAKERDDDLHTLEYGSRKAREYLVHKYKCYPNQLRDNITVRAPKTQADIVKQMREMYARIEAGNGLTLKAGQVTYEQIVNLYVNQLFDRTLVGLERELAAEKFLAEQLSEKGVTFTRAGKRTDVAEGVDYELQYRGRALLGIQVKGCAFAAHGAGDEAAIRLTAQQRAYKNRTGAPVQMLYIRGKDKDRMGVVNDRQVLGRVDYRIEKIDGDIERERENRSRYNTSRSGQQRNHQRTHQPQRQNCPQPTRNNYDER